MKKCYFQLLCTALVFLGCVNTSAAGNSAMANEPQALLSADTIGECVTLLSMMDEIPQKQLGERLQNLEAIAINARGYFAKNYCLNEAFDTAMEERRQWHRNALGKAVQRIKNYNYDAKTNQEKYITLVVGQFNNHCNAFYEDVMKLQGAAEKIGETCDAREDEAKRLKK